MIQKRQLTLLLIALVFLIGPAYGKSNSEDFDGTLQNLGEYTGNGKWAVVMIWASDCHACNAEAKNYVEFNKAHKDKDAFILGISMDGNEKKMEAKDFIKRHGVNFQNLIDEPENVADMYSTLTGRPWVGTPTFLLFNPEGELRAAQVGAVPPHLIESFMESEAKAAAEAEASKVKSN